MHRNGPCAAHTRGEELGIPMAPSGMPGVESSLPVMLDHVNAGRCTLAQVSRWMSEHVADCYSMVGKGRIEIGADADLVLVDLNLSIQVEDEHTWTRVGWSLMRGKDPQGMARSDDRRRHPGVRANGAHWTEGANPR